MTISRDEYIQLEAAAWTERRLQSSVVALASALGVEYIYHTYDSRRSAIGFPDLVLLHQGRGLAIELKSEKHKTSAARLRLQKAWLEQFDQVSGFRAFLFTPSDYLTGRIENALRWLVRQEE